jgi:hypothetical protein
MTVKSRNKFSYYLEELGTALRLYHIRRISALPFWISSRTDCSRHIQMVGIHTRHHNADCDNLHIDHMDCHNRDRNHHGDNQGGTEIINKIYEIL